MTNLIDVTPFLDNRMAARVPARSVGFSPLISYALRGLANCWLPDRQRWSHCYHLDGRAQPNRSIPESDVFYSLNVLLGMSRLSRTGLSYDLPSTFEACAALLPTLPVKKYAYGMALWAGAELNLSLPEAVERHIFHFVSQRQNWQSLRAQDIGMLVTGLAAQAKACTACDTEIVHELFDFLVRNYAGPADLFFDSPLGWRRSFASFATQTYLMLACYNYHDAFGDERALELANRCAGKLIDLQGPHGEWPWFYHVPTGKVVDFYEVYSVHQDGMAPAWLEHAELHGVAGATEAIVRGFNWILGENQMGQSMLRPASGMIVRSQARKGELERKYPRVLRSLYHASISPSQTLIGREQLTLRLECRSYHLGWILWSFGNRRDLPMLTHDAAFMAS
jgi:hypothetical protein